MREVCVEAEKQASSGGSREIPGHKSDLDYVGCRPTKIFWSLEISVFMNCTSATVWFSSSKLAQGSDCRATRTATIDVEGTLDVGF